MFVVVIIINIDFLFKTVIVTLFSAEQRNQK